jgi:hypothetical protein
MNKLSSFKAGSAIGVAANTMVQHDQEPVTDVETHLEHKNKPV